MSKVDKIISEFNSADDTVNRKIWINQISPSVKVIITILYIIFTMSNGKYDIISVSALIVYPAIMMFLCRLSITRLAWRLKIVFGAVILLGIFNPVFDQNAICHIFDIPVTTGMISMVTLIEKAFFAVAASYILFQTTSVEQICFAMRKLHVPKILVTVMLLIYRYIGLMLNETKKVTQAYSLRAPGQKGIHYKAWGSLLGHMLLRSMDRAELVYESMMLRGYNGEYYVREKSKNNILSALFFAVWCIIFVLIWLI